MARYLSEMQDVLFQALVVPHRSLSRRGVRLVMAAIGAICAANLIISTLLHAWPVFGFAGAELIFAAVMLRLNAVGARASELLLLTPDALRVVRTDARGRRQERVLSPAWLNVQMEERPGRVPALWVGSRGAREELGQFLGEAEKRDLARALAAALHRWRNPVFDNPQLRDDQSNS